MVARASGFRSCPSGVRRKMASGAGHDCAVFANEGVPCAMLFIRNEDGSHNPREKMEIGDFAVASRLLWEMLDELVA